MCSSTTLTWWLCVHSLTVFCHFWAFTNPMTPPPKETGRLNSACALVEFLSQASLPARCFPWWAPRSQHSPEHSRFIVGLPEEKNRQLLLLITCPSLSSLAKLFSSSGRIFPLSQSISQGISSLVEQDHCIIEDPELEGVHKDAPYDMDVPPGSRALLTRIQLAADQDSKVLFHSCCSPVPQGQCLSSVLGNCTAFNHLCKLQ